jgi:hypothetical protein
MTAITHRGAIAYYDVMTTLKDILLTDVNVNTVTQGDITKVNLNKQDIFPLCHMILSNVSENGQTLSFNFNILAMDIVDESKEATTNIFRGNDNEMDVLNTQLAVLNKFLQILRKGQTYREGYQVEGAANLEPFSDRFENQVSGWALNFTLVVMNNIDICDD